MIRCIVFDFDGTLVVSNNIKHQSFFEVTNHIPGARPLLEVALSDPNFGDRYIIFQYLSEKLSDKSDSFEINAADLAEEYTNLCEKRIVQAPEVTGTAKAISEISKSGIKMMVSSATPEKTLKRIVSMRGMDAMFDKVFGAPASKEQHLRAVFNNWKFTPKETVYVGDSEVDRRAALNVGCHFVGVGQDHSRFDEAPNILTESLSHLPALVAKLASTPTTLL